MLAAIERHRPAVVYLAYPNNPTANLFDDDAIERIVAARRPALVVIDEAYQPFAPQLPGPRMAAPRARAGDAHAEQVRPGRRAHRLPVGREALIDEIDKVRPPYNVSVLNAEAALFALEHADEFARQAAVLRGERARLQAALAAAGRARLPERGQHDPGARARRRSALRRA